MIQEVEVVSFGAIPLNVSLGFDLSESVAGESAVGRSLLMVFSDGIDTASFLRSERVLATARRSASLTGGRLYETEKQSDLAAIFRGVLDEFRQRYLVTYSPRGVSREGWHRLEVTVKRSGATVKARPGYQDR
ncbi:MAG: hypothetical protein ABI665_02450 [Vicinamibacterales bacterium]